MIRNSHFTIIHHVKYAVLCTIQDSKFTEIKYSALITTITDNQEWIVFQIIISDIG